jgi:hypothetical protein
VPITPSRIRSFAPNTWPYDAAVTAADIARELSAKTGAEIGVWRGAFSMRLCMDVPGLHLKCIDPWLGFRRNSQAKMDHYFDLTQHRLRPHKVEIIRKTSVEAVQDVPDKSLDFVYIDAMHEFDHVMIDLIMWAGKVREGALSQDMITLPLNGTTGSFAL